METYHFGINPVCTGIPVLTSENATLLFSGNKYKSKGHLRTNELQNRTVLSEKNCSTTCRKFQKCTSLKSESYKPKAAMWGKTRLTGLDWQIRTFIRILLYLIV